MLLGRTHWSGTTSGTQDSVEIREESPNLMPIPWRRFRAEHDWPKQAGMPSKGDEMYEASDLRIVLIDSPDPEVRTNLRRFARLESRFHSGEQASAIVAAENRMRAQPRFLTY